MIAMSFPYYRIIQCNYPITCCTRLRYFAGMGFSSFQTIFMGLLPVWLTAYTAEQNHLDRRN